MILYVKFYRVYAERSGSRHCPPSYMTELSDMADSASGETAHQRFKWVEHIACLIKVMRIGGDDFLIKSSIRARSGQVKGGQANCPAPLFCTKPQIDLNNALN